jgi:hypothetical protein
MTARRKLRRWAALAGLVGALPLLLLLARERPAAPAARAAVAAETPPTPLPPAARLRVRVGEAKAGGAALLDPADEAWGRATPTHVLLNRAPRLYRQPALPPEPPVPPLEARALRAGDKLYLRLEWADATRNAPVAPVRKSGEGGDPDRLYRRPTAETNAFPDAAAVMVPEGWSGGAFPALMMGDKTTSVRMFYWSASRTDGKGDELAASGRASPQPTGRTFALKAAHAGGKWALTAELPGLADGAPVAFAVWDGAYGDRDGLKFFSIWYVLVRE